ncbi:peptidylprolyl isomerase SurA [Orbus wheelerorum]|uniref:peptidylprolyl isomerase SurA n=1 Tax=Orbus wheelerorum TaxID=3074111 RepID=UPI00370D090E
MIKLLKMIKKIASTLLITLFVCSTTHAAPRQVESVVAVVNNNVILSSDVNEMLKNIKSTANPKNLPDDATLRHQIIDQLINENLILQQSNRAQVNVSDDEVTATIKNIAKQNGMTLDELRGYLTKMGVSYSSYRDKMRKDMLIDRTRMSQVGQRINISDKEVEALASTIAKQPMNNREINVSHILISIPENPTKQQLENVTSKAKDVINRLQNGESFAKLAATYSNDQNALKGGSMGWHKLNELPTIFEERLIRAQKGDIIGPLRSGVGYHILKVDGIRAEAAKTITVKEVNAKHILIKTNLLVTDDMAKQKLLDISQSIKEGNTTFEAAAKSYSEDPGSAEKGGELGWNNPDRYDSGFKNALLKLKKGEISQPIKSAFGWHLIELIDTRNVDRTDMAQKDQAYRLIFNRKFSEELQVWVQELKGDAYIKIIGEENP